MKIELNINWLLLILSFGRLIAPSSAGECTVCVGTDDIPTNYEWKKVLNTMSCRQFAWAALFEEDTDDICLSRYNLIGYSLCGCSPPPAEPNCHLCADGSEPLYADSFIDEEMAFTCQDVHDYLRAFPQNDNTCSSFQRDGVANCGCQPSSAPSSSPTSVLDPPPDCEALKNGDFITTDNPRLKSTKLNMSMPLGVVLSKGVELVDVKESLEKVMSNLISAGAAGCPGRRYLRNQRNLQESKIHHVVISDLSQSNDEDCITSFDGANCIISGVDITVHHSAVGSLVFTDGEEVSFFEEVKRVFGNEAVDIAEEVDGVLELQTNPEPDMGVVPETVIAVGTASGLAALLALCSGVCLYKKGQGIKRELEIDEFSKVEFLPNKQPRSDQKGGETSRALHLDEFEETDSADIGPSTRRRMRIDIADRNSTKVEMRLTPADKAPFSSYPSYEQESSSGESSSEEESYSDSSTQSSIPFDEGNQSAPNTVEI